MDEPKRMAPLGDLPVPPTRTVTRESKEIPQQQSLGAQLDLMYNLTLEIHEKLLGKEAPLPDSGKGQSVRERLNNQIVLLKSLRDEL